MTVKIKKLREQPLLNPVAQDLLEWAKVTQEDLAAMKSKLHAYGDDFNGLGLATMHLRMKALGIPIDVTGTDAAAMRDQLRHEKNSTHAWSQALMVHAMDELGLEAASGDDKTRLYSLSFQPGRKKPENVL